VYGFVRRDAYGLEHFYAICFHLKKIIFCEYTIFIVNNGLAS
jgi:hypothetical protein